MLAHAYNSTPHDSTGYSPIFLLLGFEPRGPVDYVSGVGPAIGRPKNINREAKKWLDELSDESQSISDNAKKFVQDFVREWNNYRNEARDALALSSARQARSYNKRHRFERFDPGDEVLVNPHSLELVDVSGTGKKLVQRRTSTAYIQSCTDSTTVLADWANGEGGKEAASHVGCGIRHTLKILSAEYLNQMPEKSGYVMMKNGTIK